MTHLKARINPNPIKGRKTHRKPSPAASPVGFRPCQAPIWRHPCQGGPASPPARKAGPGRAPAPKPGTRPRDPAFRGQCPCSGGREGWGWAPRRPKPPLPRRGPRPAPSRPRNRALRRMRKGAPRGAIRPARIPGESRKAAFPPREALGGAEGQAGRAQARPRKAWRAAGARPPRGARPGRRGGWRGGGPWGGKGRQGAARGGRKARKAHPGCLSAGDWADRARNRLGGPRPCPRRGGPLGGDPGPGTRADQCETAMPKPLKATNIRLGRGCAVCGGGPRCARPPEAWGGGRPGPRTLSRISPLKGRPSWAWGGPGPVWKKGLARTSRRPWPRGAVWGVAKALGEPATGGSGCFPSRGKIPESDFPIQPVGQDLPQSPFQKKCVTQNIVLKVGNMDNTEFATFLIYIT
jgi:translation initiation factor IF-2